MHDNEDDAWTVVTNAIDRFKAESLPRAKGTEHAWAQRLIEILINLDLDYDCNDGKFIQLVNMRIKQIFDFSAADAVGAYASHIIMNWKRGNMRYALEDEIRKLVKLRWVEIYYDNIMSAFYMVIERHAKNLIHGDFVSKHIATLRSWLESVIQPCAAAFFKISKNCNSIGAAPNKTGGAPTKRRDLWRTAYDSLNKYLFRAVATIRASEMFDIVTEFPDSLPAILELRDVCQATATHGHIGKVFRKDICKRLLHPGASTSQILDVYISIIRMMRVLDPSDLMLNFVARPIRDYLIDRKDTVRCVVSSMTASKDSDLHGELRRGGSLEYGQDEDDEEGGPGENWEPRKRDPDLTESGIRGLDVLALLVSIYGTTDVFVAEYRTLLADKLVNSVSYSTDYEVTTLELLKMRFGEDALHSCEVMLRDIEDSRRCNNAVKSDLNLQLQRQQQQSSRKTPAAAEQAEAAQVVDMAVLSDQYWPSLSDSTAAAAIEGIVLHPTAVALLDQYTNTFAALKKPRKLNVYPHLGTVQLDLNFDDGATRTFHVSPIHASLILHVADDSTAMEMSSEMSSCSSGRSSTDLAFLMSIDEEVVRRKMAFWVAKGVVSVRSREMKHDPSDPMFNPAAGDPKDELVYEVIETQRERAEAERAALELAGEAGGEVMRAEDDDDDEMEGGIGAGGNTNEKALHRVIEGYMRGMLSSQGSMSIERIHSMLKLMINTDSGGAGDNAVKYDMTVVNLRRFLQTLIDSDKLEYIDGMYCKPTSR